VRDTTIPSPPSITYLNTTSSFTIFELEQPNVMMVQISNIFIVQAMALGPKNSCFYLVEEIIVDIKI